MGLLHAWPFFEEEARDGKKERKEEEERKVRRKEGEQRGSPNEFKYLNYKSRGRASFMAAPR